MKVTSSRLRLWVPYFTGIRSSVLRGDFNEDGIMEVVQRPWRTKMVGGTRPISRWKACAQNRTVVKRERIRQDNRRSSRNESPLFLASNAEKSAAPGLRSVEIQRELHATISRIVLSCFRHTKTDRVELEGSVLCRAISSRRDGDYAQRAA
jgi:hypothetical protein